VIPVLILYVIGMPLAAFLFLWWNRRVLFDARAQIHVTKIMQHSSSARASSSSQSFSDLGLSPSSTPQSASRLAFFVRWSPLFAMFSPSAWFWQPFIL